MQKDSYTSLENKKKKKNREQTKSNLLKYILNSPFTEFQ